MNDPKKTDAPVFPMTTEHYIATRKPRSDACAYLSKFPTVRAAFEACADIDWLMWFLWREPSTPAISRALRRIATRMIRETPLSDGRTVWDLLADGRSRRAVEIAELHAEGRASDLELAYIAARAYDAVAAHATAAAAARVDAAVAAAAAHATAHVDAATAAIATAAAARAATRAAVEATQLRIVREEVADLDLEPLRD